MIAELLEEPDFLFFAVMAAAGLIWFTLRRLHRDLVLDTHLVASLGTVAGLRLYVVSAGARRYVTLEYEDEDDDGDISEIEVVFGARQASALALHLEAAAYPHASLTYARAMTRRARASRAADVKAKA